MRSKESTEPSQKRARMSEDADDAVAAAVGKKARGRPRVDTHDATAADRRRTQIRLAQRAYRQRKETTIASLKKQSTQLRAIIGEMNTTFQHLSDSMVQSGILRLNPNFAREVKQAAEVFNNCVTSANDRPLDSEEDEVHETVPNSTISAARSQAQSSQIGAPAQIGQSWDSRELSHVTVQSQPEPATSQPESYLSNISSSSYDLSEPSNGSSLVHRWQFTVGEVLDQSRSANAPQQSRAMYSQPQPRQQQHQSLPFGLVDLPSREQSPFVPPYIFPVSVPAIGAELPPTTKALFDKALYPSAASLTMRTLLPNYTSSFEEVTFGRRLTRATLESGFVLLSNSQIHPAVLGRIFQLSLPYLTLDEIRFRFKSILARGVDEDLDWYATPFLHLGGAGTHYERRDSHGKPISLKNNWTIRQIGPLDQRMVRTERVSDGQVQDLKGIDLTGLEGEWFDAYDVQGYLEEKWNCRIDSKSSFAECSFDDESANTSDNEIGSPGLSRESTVGTSDDSPPPIPHTTSATPNLYGLDMSFNAPASNFFAVPVRPSFTDLSFDQTLGLDLAPGFDLSFVGNSGYSTLSLDMMSESRKFPVVKQKQRKVAWLDVQKLIDRLIKGAVCLGRGPGFRRQDVDEAFRDALVPAY